MAGEVVPFGKYKGLPVEALAQDRQYVEWLTAQPWFKDRYGAIYTLVVNNFGAPADTPEHNALQMRFLDAAFRAAFVALLDSGHSPENVQFEVSGFDVAFGGVYIECKPTVGDDYPAVLRQMRAAISAPIPVDGPGRGRFLMPSLGAQGGKFVLFLEEYIGIGATVEQFIAFFESAEIQVVFLDEVT